MSLKKSLSVALVFFITSSVGFAGGSSAKLDKLAGECAVLMDVYSSMSDAQHNENDTKSFLYSSSISSINPYLPLSDEYGLAGKFIKFRMEMAVKIDEIISDDFLDQQENLSTLIKDMCSIFKS